VTNGARSVSLIIPSLFLSGFATQPAVILTGLLLIDIALTFGSPVGIMGQITTLSSTLAVIFSLLMGVLSIRFKHKSLLMMGLFFFSISALSCYFAPNFNTFLICYSISGVGMAMVAPMAGTLVADHFPLDKRTSAMGWIYAGAALSYIIGAPLIGFIAGFGGWRLPFLAFVMPISLLSLLLVAKGLPSTLRSQQPTMSRMNYFEGFKGIFLNRSATACLVGNALISASWQMSLYSSSFFRQRFLISTGFASILILGGASLYTLGSLVSGRFVKRLGMKPLTVLTAFFAGVFVISYTNLPNLWLSLSVSFLVSLFSGIGAPTASSLTLEQVPKFRGAMMSINWAATSMGTAFGAAVGGFVLLLLDYEFVGISLGAMNIVAAIVFYLLVIDPTRTYVHNSES